MDLWTLPENLYLTSKEAAAASCGALSSSQLVRARMGGWGPRFLKLGSSKNAVVRYRVKDLRDWIEQRQCQNTAQVAVRVAAEGAV